MRKSSILTITILSMSLLLVGQASAITISWTGKVPSLNCSSNPISNQEKLQDIQKKCATDFQIIPAATKNSNKESKQNKPMIAFNL